MTTTDELRPATTDGPRLITPSRNGPGPTNRSAPLVPSHGLGSGRVGFDLPGLLVGTAEYADGPTGATVLHFPRGARTAVDERGGAVGLIGGYPFNDALCFAGGSVYGLAAATGVAEELLERDGGRVAFDRLKTVSGAIIYDFSVRDNAIHPDGALGAAALRAARADSVTVGRAGAGAGASAGKVDWSRTEHTGQGAAFRQAGDVKVFVLTVVNPVGVVVDRDGRVVRGNYDALAGERRHPEADFSRAFHERGRPAIAAGNTTVTAVVTNVALGDAALAQFARQVHSSMHRAIQPFHTAMDGDVLFAATTDEVVLPTDPSSRFGALSITPTAVGAIASEAAWDAVLSAAR
ncbi:P1 family peptidase [Kineococcus arenarius]|uniref:P1 family peptidase n=1 Tax=unclassified Kineococcus TaxID=2621656 RepID=UPI003D7CF80C